jgi:predicted O-methyltransferase YrrM
MPNPLTLNQYLKICGFTRFEGNVDKIAAQKSFLASQARRPDVKEIMEIGFNAGHSSHLFLSSSRANIVSFDIGKHRYVKKSKNYLDSRYPNRHRLILGDSRQTVPEYSKANPDKRFDLIFIDGGHSYQVAWRDLANCRRLAHSNTVIVVDDIVLLSSWQRHYNTGPLRAWNRMKERGQLQEEGHIDYGPGRGWSWGRYVYPAKGN